MNFKPLIVKTAFAAFLALPTLSFAQVCIGQTGTLGRFAVTASCTGATQGTPLANHESSASGFCTYNFSPAATPADILVQTYAVDKTYPDEVTEVVSFSFNGSPYTLSQSELPPNYRLSGSGATTTNLAGATSRPYWTFSNAPASITSVKISHSADAWFLAGVCVPAAPATPAPTVTAVSPTSGSNAGGTSITITGTDFTGATAITVGGAACTSFVASATSATCTTPAGTAGNASVLVTTPSGTNAANTLFTYQTNAVCGTAASVASSIVPSGNL